MATVRALALGLALLLAQFGEGIAGSTAGLVAEAGVAQGGFEGAAGFVKAQGGGLQANIEAHVAQFQGAGHDLAQGRVVNVDVRFAVAVARTALAVIGIGAAFAVHFPGFLVHLAAHFIQLAAGFIELAAGAVQLAGVVVQPAAFLVSLAAGLVRHAGTVSEAAAWGGLGHRHHRHLLAGAALGFRGLVGGHGHGLTVHHQAGQPALFVAGNHDGARVGGTDTVGGIGGRCGEPGRLGLLAADGHGRAYQAAHCGQRGFSQRAGQRHAAAQQAQPAQHQRAGHEALGQRGSGRTALHQPAHSQQQGPGAVQGRQGEAGGNGYRGALRPFGQGREGAGQPERVVAHEGRGGVVAAVFALGAHAAAHEPHGRMVEKQHFGHGLQQVHEVVAAQHVGQLMGQNSFQTSRRQACHRAQRQQNHGPHVAHHQRHPHQRRFQQLHRPLQATAGRQGGQPLLPYRRQRAHPVAPQPPHIQQAAQHAQAHGQQAQQPGHHQQRQVVVQCVND